MLMLVFSNQIGLISGPPHSLLNVECLKCGGQRTPRIDLLFKCKKSNPLELFALCAFRFLLWVARFLLLSFFGLLSAPLILAKLASAFGPPATVCFVSLCSTEGFARTQVRSLFLLSPATQPFLSLSLALLRCDSWFFPAEKEPNFCRPKTSSLLLGSTATIGGGAW